MAGFLNRVGMSISTTGTGTVTANTLIDNGFLTPAEAGAVDGQQYYWLLEEGTDFEIFIGTWTLSGTTVSRDTVIKSKISGTAGTTKLTLAGGAQLRSISEAAAFANLGGVGKQMIPIMASGMVANTTNGPASSTSEMSTNLNMFVTLGFDASTAESAQFAVPMPTSWNEGTVTFQPIWMHPSTTTNFGVVWELAGVAISDDDAGDVAFGTGQTSTDTGGTTNDVYIGPESSAITIAGTPAAGDLVIFRIKRLPANASDTMAVDAKLIGIRLYITTDAGHD